MIVTRQARITVCAVSNLSFSLGAMSNCRFLNGSLPAVVGMGYPGDLRSRVLVLRWPWLLDLGFAFGSNESPEAEECEGEYVDYDFERTIIEIYICRKRRGQREIEEE